MGKARITLNGKRVATIDLSATRTSKRTIVWARNFDARRKGRIRVTSVDGKVILRGFVVLR